MNPSLEARLKHPCCKRPRLEPAGAAELVADPLEGLAVGDEDQGLLPALLGQRNFDDGGAKDMARVMKADRGTLTQRDPLAIAVALALEPDQEPQPFPMPPTALVSTWQAVVRARQLGQRGSVR